MSLERLILGAELMHSFHQELESVTARVNLRAVFEGPEHLSIFFLLVSGKLYLGFEALKVLNDLNQD